MGSYSYRELTKKLKKLGFEFYRQGKGSHTLWIRRKDNTAVPIPRHEGRDIRSGTLRKIIKQVGLKNMQELDEL
jgi:predicted RNA binding protein YcfA (HicA-like mRNA interferase family)